MAAKYMGSPGLRMSEVNLMYKQIIIARKDLNMSPGKLAAQVSHGSMAFLMEMIRACTQRRCINRYKTCDRTRYPYGYLRADLARLSDEAFARGEDIFYAKPEDPDDPKSPFIQCDPEFRYTTDFEIDPELYENWINGEFTKCVLKAKNKNHLLKAKSLAEDLGMVEGEDFWLIRDNCHTELEPEEDGRTLTAIGFRPMDSEVIDQIGKRYQLYS